MKDYFSRNMKVKEEELKYDFLPSMISIIEKPANRLCNIIMYVIISMMVLTLLWAAIFKLDIVVSATGSTMPESGVITLKPMYGGNISEICVNSGDFVHTGDKLFTIENKSASLTYDKCKYTVDVLYIQREVYQAVYANLTENNGANLSVDTSVYGDLSSVAQAIVLENDLYLEKYNNAAWGDRESLKKEHMFSVVDTINSINANIKTSEIELERAESELNKYTITATCDGKITLPGTLYSGMLVSSGDSLGYITEQTCQNTFVAYVSDKDINQIKSSQRIKVKIGALDDTKYEIMSGKVVQIPDVATTVEGLGSVYAVKISLNEYPKTLKSGMSGQVDIIVGKRSVLEYFLDPFKKGLSNSLKEK